MHRQTRITVDLAVQILRSTLDETSAGRVDTVPVRLALRRLWSHCPERWPLVMFWEVRSRITRLAAARASPRCSTG
jgi:hypothetical protein